MPNLVTKRDDAELISKLISDKIVYTKESPNNSSGWRLTIGQNGQPDLVPTLLGDSFGSKSTNKKGKGQENTQFSLKDDLKPVFYSNAERAVEGLKQEKATPEQWKAML